MPATAATPPRPCQNAAFSPDGALLATANVDGSVYLWEIAGSIDATVLPIHKSQVTGVVFVSPQLLASTSWDGSLRLTSLPSGAYSLTAKSKR